MAANKNTITLEQAIDAKWLHDLGIDYATYANEATYTSPEQPSDQCIAALQALKAKLSGHPLFKAKATKNSKAKKPHQAQRTKRTQRIAARTTSRKSYHSNPQRRIMKSTI